MKNSIVDCILIPVDKALGASSVQLPFKRWVFQFHLNSHISCFTSTDHKRTIRDRETSMATSTHTFLVLHPQITKGLSGTGRPAWPPQLTHFLSSGMAVKKSVITVMSHWASKPTSFPSRDSGFSLCSLIKFTASEPSMSANSLRDWFCREANWSYFLGVCDLLYGHPFCACTCQRQFFLHIVASPVN